MPAMTRPAPTPPPQPLERPARIQALDAARAAAIVGMIAVNVGPRGQEGIVALLYELPVGRASLLFMLLAGIGMSILSRSARRRGGRPPWKTVLWRAGLLLAMGLALQLMDHDVRVILPTYGLIFLASLPLLQAPTGVLAAVTGIVFAAGPLVWIGAQMANGQPYEFASPTLLDTPPQILHGIALSGAYPAVVWAAPFLAGMLLGRADLRNRALHKRLVLWGAVAAVGGNLLSRLLTASLGEPTTGMGWDHLVSAADHSQMPLWLVSGTGSALFVLGICLLAEKTIARRLGAITAAGRLALTIYVGHLLALAAIVRPEPHYLYEGVFITIALSLAAVVFADMWTSRYRTGPLEYLLHRPGSKKRPSA